MKIQKDQLLEIVTKATYQNDGDSYEKEYWQYIISTFINSQTFWQYFVVPTTKRLDTDPKQRFIHPRDNISQDIRDIASIHYSLFLNLIYAHDHYQNFRLSSFEDFYVHLGSACDLAEDFLLKIYLLIQECTGKESDVLQAMSKQEFIDLASNWYEKNYSKVYENYIKKGKSLPIHIPSKNNVLDEYLNESMAWKEYKRTSRTLREYRNVIVHDVQIGGLFVNEKRMVPKKQEIGRYKKWSQVFAVAENPKILGEDFIETKEQMTLDVKELQSVLNSLWDKPINDLKELIFIKNNEVILNKYDLEF